MVVVLNQKSNRLLFHEARLYLQKTTKHNFQHLYESNNFKKVNHNCSVPQLKSESQIQECEKYQWMRGAGTEHLLLKQ